MQTDSSRNTQNEGIELREASGDGWSPQLEQPAAETTMSEYKLLAVVLGVVILIIAASTVIHVGKYNQKQAEFEENISRAEITLSQQRFDTDEPQRKWKRNRYDLQLMKKYKAIQAGQVLQGQTQKDKDKDALKLVEFPIEMPEATSDRRHMPEPQHHDEVPLTFSYPTMGIPIPGQKFNFTLVEAEDLYAFDVQFLQLFEPYNDTDCQYAKYNSGKANEANYILCSNYLADSEAVINLGIDGRDSFGCALTTVHSMPNYQYDCTGPVPSSCNTNGGLDHFYPQCIGEVTEKGAEYTYISLQDMVKRHGLADKHWSLKINTEGAENQALKYFPVEDLQWIDSVVIEVHLGGIYPEGWGNLEILKTLADHFAVINFHENNNSGACFEGQEKRWRKLRSRVIEISLVNRRLIIINSPTRSFVQHPLNTRDEPRNLPCS